MIVLASLGELEEWSSEPHSTYKCIETNSSADTNDSLVSNGTADNEITYLHFSVFSFVEVTIVFLLAGASIYSSLQVCGQDM